MPDPARLTSISPLFIVADLHASVAFYTDQLGFESTLLIPESEPFFAIVRRGRVEIFLKAVGDGVEPLPNPERHGNARWDAYVEAPDPDALAAELQARGVALSAPLGDWDDGLRGLELRDRDGYVLFFGRPLEPSAARRARVQCVQPVLAVRDVAAALRFYETLGFETLFQNDPEPQYAGIRRGGAELHLQWHDASEWERGGDRPNYRLPVDDPDRLSQEFEASGAVLDLTPIGDTPWGTREFHVRDPDGNGLQFYRDL
jgi:catechol 2,3-dioxygenase-like lactoylglutathione lyase family enzyme